MKSRISQAVAALLMVGAASTAYSQNTVTPAAATPAAPPPPAYVNEPIASVSRADDMANAIAQAIGADASMQGAKITVQPEENLVLLTGVTATEAQRVKATQLATAHASGKPVVNAISASEVVIQVPDPAPANDAEAMVEVPATEAPPQTDAVPPAEATTKTDANPPKEPKS